jgi:hypothetical protein
LFYGKVRILSSQQGTHSIGKEIYGIYLIGD